MAAVVTLLDVAAERGGAALFDGRHHAVLRRRENGSDLGSEGVWPCFSADQGHCIAR